MADTLESLEIKVVHSASGADAEIGKLASAIGSLKTAITGTPAALKELAAALKAVHESCKGGTAKFDKFAESMANVAASAEMLGDNSNSVMTLANAMSTLSEVKVTASSFNSLSSGVEKVGAAAKSVTPEAIENLDKMVTSLAKLQGVDLQGLGSAMSAVRRVGAAKEPEAKVPLTEDMQALISSASQIDVLEAKLMSLRDAMQEAFSAGDMDKAYSIRGQILQTEAALEKARAAADKAGKATKEAAKGVKELSKEANKSKGPLDNFIGSLKRIAFYRFIRTIIKAITQAFQEGLQNAYAFSQGITTEGHRFAAALDSMSTSGLTMKNQLGSAFIGLLAAIAPIVNQIISLVTKLADVLSQIFAVFTGSTYLKAVDVPKKWGDAAGGAAKAAKEWKNQLLGFDEINRLEEPSDPSGGGGGGSALDPSQMFEDTPIAEWIMRLKEKIQPIIDDIKMILDGLGKFVRGVFLGDWQLMAEGIAQVIEGLSSLVRHTVGLIGELVDNLLSGIQNIGNSFFTWLEEKTGLDLSWLRGIWNDAMWDLRKYVSEMFSDVQGVLKGLSDFIVGAFTGDWSRAWSGVQLIFINVWNALVGTVEYAINQMIFAINPLLGAINQISAFFGGPQIGGISLPRLNASRAGTTVGGSGMSHSSGRFANGGYPESGQLFFAREDGAGAELVGTVGGRTAVASNDDIMNGIRQGVYEAVSAAMSSASTGEPVVRVYLDSREIKNGQNRLNRALGVG